MKRGRREDESREAVAPAAGPLLMENSRAVLACLEVTSLPAAQAHVIMGYRDDWDIYSTFGAFAANCQMGVL